MCIGALSLTAQMKSCPEFCSLGYMYHDMLLDARHRDGQINLLPPLTYLAKFKVII